MTSSCNTPARYSRMGGMRSPSWKMSVAWIATLPGAEAPAAALTRFLTVPPPASDGFEYAVLVTTLDQPLERVAQLYRDRADAENVNDELKNHWGWGGFTTDDLERTAIMARFTALIYVWWTIFCRSLMPTQHIEAHTARPLLVQGVGRLTHHRGARILRITGIAHGAAGIAQRLTRSARQLSAWLRTVAQLGPLERWPRLADRIFKAIVTALGSIGSIAPPLRQG